MTPYLRQGMIVGVWGFFSAILISFSAQSVITSANFLISFLILLAIILIGIVFDIVGVAVTAASEMPFHAMAAKKVHGAKEAIKLIRNAAQVANFCTDIVGDIAGTISGAAGTTVVHRLLFGHPNWNEKIVGMLMIGIITSLTIGGKAIGKGFAIQNANEITFQAAKIVRWFEHLTGFSLFSQPTKPSLSKKNRK